MTLASILTLLGGVLLLAGLLLALLSSRYEAKVMGNARLGIGVLGPNPGSEEWKEKERLCSQADRWFWGGITLTAVGIIAQTAGALLGSRNPQIAVSPALLTVSGLALDVLGVLLISWPLLIPQARSFDTMEAIRARLLESVLTRTGIGVLVLGLVLQIIGAWMR